MRPLYMATATQNKQSSRPNVTIIRGKDNSVTVYDNETRKKVIDTSVSEIKKEGGFSRRGKTSSGETVSVDQFGRVYEEENSKQPQLLSEPKPEAGTVIEKNGYTYKYDAQGGFETIKRPDAVQKQLNETIALNQRINRGERITAKDIARGEQEIKFTDEKVAQIRASAYQDELRRLNQQKELEMIEQRKKEEASIFLSSGLSPVATSKTGGEIYSDYRGSYFTPQRKQIGSNITALSFKGIPAPTVQTSQFSNLSTSEKLRFGSAVIGQGFGEKRRQVSDKIVEVATKDTIKIQDTDVFQTYSGERVSQYDRYVAMSRNPLAILTAATRTSASRYVSAQKELVQNDPVIGVVQRGLILGTSKIFSVSEAAITKGAPLISNFGQRNKFLAKSAPLVFASAKYAPLVFSAARQTAQPFVEQSIKDPVMAYAAIAGPRKLGKVAYGALDWFDVGQSVVTQGVKGFMQTGTPGGLVAGAIGGFVGEKASDKAAFFGATPMRSEIPNPSVSFKVRTRSTYDLVVTPKQSAPNKFSITVGTTREPTFRSVTRLPSVKTLKKQDGPLVYYQTTQLPSKQQPFGKQLLPKVVNIDLNRKYGPARPRPQRVQGGILKFGFFGNKRGQMSLSSLTGGYGADTDNQGAITNFQGTLPTFTPTTQINILHISRPAPRTRNYTQKSYNSFTRNIFASSSRPYTVSNYATGYMGGALSLTRSNAGARTLIGSITLSPSLSQTMTQSQTLSPSITQTQTLSPSITSTMTQTMSLTPTITETLTQTLTRTQTQTRTPTKTPTRLFRQQKKTKFFGLKTKKFVSKTKYTPTAAALGFSIRGRKLKGTLTGLEFRGIAR